MGSAGAQASYADTAKRLAGRSLLAVGSGLAAGSRLVAAGVSKGVAALTDNGDKEEVRSLKFAVLEWSVDSGSSEGGSGGSTTLQRLPVLLVGLATGFQVWRLDGSNPAELLSRRDGPITLLEAVPEPCVAAAEEDALHGDRPLLAVVPAPEHSMVPVAAVGSGGQPAAVQHQQHSVLLYSLRSQGYVHTLSFGGEVLGVAASSRLLVVALRGQLQAFDAASLQHTFSCLTYMPPAPPLLSGCGGSGSSNARRHHQPQQQFVVEGLTSSASSAGSDSSRQQHHVQQVQQPPAPAVAAALAPFALGARWLAYAADTPVPQASGQAVAQRLPLARRDSASTGTSGSLADPSGSGGMALSSSPGAGARGNGFTSAAVADAALHAAAKSGQQLKAGLAAVGSLSFKYLSQQYSSWRQGQQGQLQQRDLDALEADALVAGTVVVRDAASRLVVAHFRAHTSPLAALEFSPGGTLLATASVAGHSINLFRIVPPPPVPAGADGLVGGGGTASLQGHAVWLYRLYRGVTPAAIRGISFAPDAAWVSASSGRGTTHLFHTPAAAPGAQQAAQLQPPQQQAQPGDTGVVGQPPKQPAVGRARKPGLLSGSVAGAATSAARNLYAGQPTDAVPIAAAFLSAGPSSPTSAGSPAAAGSSLYVVTSDGLFTRHLLRPPAAPAPVPAPVPGSGGAAQGGLERQDFAAAAALEEADRWDVARHASWPEREDPLPGLLPSAALAPLAAGAAEQQQLWVAQAESGALAAPGTAEASPLWHDPQFRFYQLQLHRLQQRQQPGAAAEALPAGAPADVLAAQAATLDGSSGSGAGEAAWLESIPARPIQQQQQ